MKKLARKQSKLENTLQKDFPRYKNRNAQRHYQRLSLLTAFLFLALVVGGLIENQGANQVGLAGGSIQKGDVNEDGSITRGDVYLAYDIVQGTVRPTATQRSTADVNGDNAVTIEDVRLIFGRI